MDAVGDSSEFYRELFEKVSDGMFVHDPETGEVIDANPAAAEITGFPLEKIIGKPVTQFSAGAASAVEQTASDLINRAVMGEELRFEWLVQRPDGALRTTEVSLHRTTVAGEDTVLAVMRDATERVASRGELQSLNQDLKAVLEASPIPIVGLDADQTVRQWNPAAEALFGVPAEEAIGGPYRAVPPERRKEFDQLFDRVLDGHRISNVEISRVRADGSAVDLSINAGPVYDSDGSPTGAVATFTDITDQKRRQRLLDALREATQSLVTSDSEERIGEIAITTAREALGYSMCSMWLHNEDTDRLEPVAETEAAVEFVGHAPAFPRGEGLLWAVLESGSTKRIDDLTNHSDRFNAETPFRSEIIVPIDDHGVFVVSTGTVGAFDEADVQVLETLAGALDAALDRLAGERLLKEREHELRRQNEQLESFADIVAHDLRNPLSVAQGFLELSRETGDVAHFERVERAHARMERLIDDLLTLARQGQSIAEREPIELEDLARECWPQTRESTQLTVVEGLPVVSGDRSRLEQMFANLYRNAVTHGGDDVDVRVGPLSEGRGFFIEDDGPGIPPGKRPHVFDYGYTTSGEGTGFGLAIVREVVEAHGWEIVAREATTGGARFEVRTGESTSR